ncbi:hypothetical protein YC2023_085998 [Brassica napus]
MEIRKVMFRYYQLKRFPSHVSYRTNEVRNRCSTEVESPSSSQYQILLMEPLSEALASSTSSEGRTYKKCFSLPPSSSNRRPGVRRSTFESLRLGLSSQSIASGFLRFWDSLNFKKDREFVGITVLFLDEKVLQVIANTNLEIGKHSIFGSSKQDYNQANSSGMTYQQLKISQKLIPYFPYLKKSIVFLVYFFIYATLASVMDSSLPRIALTMVSGKKKILLLKKDRDNPVIFSLACLTSGADETQHPRQTKLMQESYLDGLVQFAKFIYEIFDWENLSDIHKSQQNEEYTHATVRIHRRDRSGPKLPKRILQARYDSCNGGWSHNQINIWYLSSSCRNLSMCREKVNRIQYGTPHISNANKGNDSCHSPLNHRSAIYWLGWYRFQKPDQVFSDNETGCYNAMKSKLPPVMSSFSPLNWSHQRHLLPKI